MIWNHVQDYIILLTLLLNDLCLSLWAHREAGMLCVVQKPVHTYIAANKHLPKYPLLHSWDITHGYWKGENKSSHIISPGNKNRYGMWLCGLGVRDEVEGVLGGRVGVKEVEWAKLDTFGSSTNKRVERVVLCLWIIPKK